jgi:peptidoglycan/LPS O-acetylase OafA/YrhL
MPIASRPAHLYTLDALRGVAALAVVLFHWPIWYHGANGLPDGFDPAQMPGYGALFFFYRAGGAGVELFFSLSGFIFFWLYREAVQQRAVSAWHFGVLRFSRLYPLHLATLLFVAGAQLAYTAVAGYPFVFKANDWDTLWRQLLIAPAWVPDRLYGFNAPVWTLIVEAFLYAVFFAAARWVRLNAAATVLMIMAAARISTYSTDLGNGVAAFFVGGGVCLLHEQLLAQGARVAAIAEAALKIAVLSLWPFTVFFVWSDYALADTDLAFLRGGRYTLFVLFPATILYLALAETRRGHGMRGLRWLGDISYSSYLLHFPLMLGCALALRLAGAPLPSVFGSLWGVIGFMGALVALSLASHHWFERPVQRWLRSRLLRGGQGRAPLDRSPQTAPLL